MSWRVQLNRSIRELRFVVKQGPSHSGVNHWCLTALPALRQYNQQTFFTFTEITDDFETDSAVHFLYHDNARSGEAVLTEGLSAVEFEKILKEKVAYGLTLERMDEPVNNDDREMPTEVVEARKLVEYLDDEF